MLTYCPRSDGEMNSGRIGSGVGGSDARNEAMKGIWLIRVDTVTGTQCTTCNSHTLSSLETHALPRKRGGQVYGITPIRAPHAHCACTVRAPRTVLPQRGRDSPTALHPHNPILTALHPHNPEPTALNPQNLNSTALHPHVP